MWNYFKKISTTKLEKRTEKLKNCARERGRDPASHFHSDGDVRGGVAGVGGLALGYTVPSDTASERLLFGMKQ